MRACLLLTALAVFASTVLVGCAGLDRRTAVMPPPPPEQPAQAPPAVVEQPPATPPPPPPPAPPQPQGTYTVRKGDNLWKIAGKPEIYGDSKKWRRIWEANKHQLSDPNKLKPGMVLIIPRD